MMFFSPRVPNQKCEDRVRNQPIGELEQPLDHVLAHAHHRADVVQSAEEMDCGGPASVHIQ